MKDTTVLPDKDALIGKTRVTVLTIAAKGVDSYCAVRKAIFPPDGNGEVDLKEIEAVAKVAGLLALIDQLIGDLPKLEQIKIVGASKIIRDIVDKGLSPEQFASQLDQALADSSVQDTAQDVVRKMAQEILGDTKATQAPAKA